MLCYKGKENLYLLALERYFTNSRDFFRKQAEQAVSPLQNLADHLRGFSLLTSNDAARKGCMLTKTMVDTRSTDAALADQSRPYMLAMRTEIANVFEAAKANGEIAVDADPKRLARRYQANLTALRLELHQGTEQIGLDELAEDMAREVEALRR